MEIVQRYVSRECRHLRTSVQRKALDTVLIPDLSDLALSYLYDEPIKRNALPRNLSAHSYYPVKRVRAIQLCGEFKDFMVDLIPLFYCSPDGTEPCRIMAYGVECDLFSFIPHPEIQQDAEGRHFIKYRIDERGRFSFPVEVFACYDSSVGMIHLNVHGYRSCLFSHYKHTGEWLTMQTPNLNELQLRDPAKTKDDDLERFVLRVPDEIELKGKYLELGKPRGIRGFAVQTVVLENR